jgi:hypothetical protein
MILAYSGDGFSITSKAAYRPTGVLPKWSRCVLAGFLFGLALITKILVAPASVGLALWVNVKGRARSWIWILFGGSIPVAAVSEYWLKPYTAQLRAMDRYYWLHQFAPHSLAGLLINFERAAWTGQRDGLLPTLLHLDPVLTLVGLLGAIIAWRTRSDGDILLGGWLVSLMAALACLSYTPSRYDVLFLPALAGLAARALSGWKPIHVAAVCAVFVAINGARLYRPLAQPAYTVQDGGLGIAAELAPGSIVIGQAAPQLCMNTRLTSVMVQPGLANDVRPIEALHADAVMITRSPYWTAWWTARYPGMFTSATKVETLQLGSHMIVDVYRVKAATKEKTSE